MTHITKISHWKTQNINRVISYVYVSCDQGSKWGIENVQWYFCSHDVIYIHQRSQVKTVETNSTCKKNTQKHQD